MLVMKNYTVKLFRNDERSTPIIEMKASSEIAAYALALAAFGQRGETYDESAFRKGRGLHALSGASVRWLTKSKMVGRSPRRTA